MCLSGEALRLWHLVFLFLSYKHVRFGVGSLDEKFFCNFGEKTGSINIMETDRLEEMMKEAGVRISPVRTLIARAIAEADRPVSGLEIECALATVDRSSITRALSLFVSTGLVHTIEDGSGSVKYELCSSPHSHNDSEGDPDLHPHFHCLVCGRTFCLHDQSIPVLPLPPGFTARSANLVIKGRCAACSDN